MNSLNFKYDEIIVKTNDEILLKLNKKLNYYKFPIIFINNNFIGGYNNLRAMYDSGELIKYLDRYIK